MQIRAASPPPAVTTTDLWKLAGIVLVLIDHYGLFFDEEREGWRVVGRLAAPIFFFLIGYARTRRVPWTWLVLGALLTGTDFLTSDEGWRETPLNILINLALLRLALPHVERHVLPSPWRVAALAVAVVLAIPLVAPVLEYGAEGWLWALLGLLARAASDRPELGRTRDLTALAVAATYILVEIRDYEFEGAEAAALAVLVAGLAALLARFRRADLVLALPAPLAAPLRFTGRRSLEIYAATLFAMQVLAYSLDDEGGGDDEPPA